MFKMFKARLTAFRDDTRGTVTVESALMIPMLFWAWATMYVFFDAYRQTSVNVKAAYTISDMVSRETTPINPAYMNGAYALLELLTRSPEPTKLRVTVIRWDNVNQKYKMDCSKTKGNIGALTNTAVGGMASKLPVMVHNERLIFIETWSKYSPPFRVGLQEQDLYNAVFTRPRFAPQVIWNDS
jgi:hypothetical protein